MAAEVSCRSKPTSLVVFYRSGGSKVAAVSKRCQPFANTISIEAASRYFVGAL